MNPFKRNRTFEGSRIPWNSHGILLPERPKFTLDPYLHGGAYYGIESQRTKCNRSSKYYLIQVSYYTDGKMVLKTVK